MNLPQISDYSAVADYLSKFGIDFQFSSVKEVANISDDLVSFKYNVTLKNNKNETMRAGMFATYNCAIGQVKISFWNIVNSVFSLARLAHVNTCKNFCEVLKLNYDDVSKKIYNKCRRQWNRLIDLGLDCDDIGKIIVRSIEAA